MNSTDATAGGKDQDPTYVHRAFSAIAKRYVVTNHLLSGFIDIFWRRRVAAIVAAEEPSVVVDVATGSGDLLMEMQRKMSDATFYGADFCEPMLREAHKRGLAGLVVADGMKLPFEDRFADALTVAYGLRNMADWEAALREFRRVLRPDAQLVILDFALPENPLLRRIYRLYLHHVLPRLAGALTRNQQAYAYLGDSIERFPRHEQMLQLMSETGFSSCRRVPLLNGVSQIYIGNT